MEKRHVRPPTEEELSDEHSPERVRASVGANDGNLITVADPSCPAVSAERR